MYLSIIHLQLELILKYSLVLRNQNLTKILSLNFCLSMVESVNPVFFGSPLFISVYTKIYKKIKYFAYPLSIYVLIQI